MSTPEVYRELESAAWNEINPSKCPCRSHGGWLLSDFDSWHRCKTHGAGVPHPESDEDFDSEAHNLTIHRVAFETFNTIAVRNGFVGGFNAACAKLMPAGDRSPKAWVDAAEKISETYHHEREEMNAAQRGFSCALEARLDDEAEQERADARNSYSSHNWW